jgi:hypothetical protein
MTSARAERASAALRPVLEAAARVLRGLTLLAIAAAAAVLVVWLAWVADTPPSHTDAWLERLVVLAVLLAPSAVLLLFVTGLRDLAKLPERTRAMPADLRARAHDLQDRARARRPSRRRGILGVIVALYRLGRVVVGSREVLSPYAAVMIALRPAMLVAAISAALAAAAELPGALIALVVMYVT